MGYETRIRVVHVYSFDPQYGTELATFDLSKCGDGPLGKLIAKHTHKPKKGKEPPFKLYARNPERQTEAVELLRDIASNENIPAEELSLTKEEIKKLSNHIEDGYISTDCYGDLLGVIDIDDFIQALEEELKIEPYRRFQWALNLLKSILGTWDDRSQLKVITYGH